MKRLSTILMFLSIALTISALDMRQKNINDIKKRKAFLYSDVTMKTREEAASLAYEQIQQEILAWASERSKKKEIPSVDATELNKVVDTIMVRRAEMFRVVAYVRKVKLVSVFREWRLTLNPVLDVDKEGDLDSNDTLVVEQPPIRKEDVQKKDTVSKKSVENSPETNDSVIANDSIRNLLFKNYLGRKGGVIEQIKKARNFFELKQIMEPLKQKGDITDYGKYATALKPEDCYLIVYDPAGNIKALLGKGKKVRTNLKTGQDDNIDNYRGCGAIWFLLSE